MDCVLDEDVKAVAEFMQNQIPASRLWLWRKRLRRLRRLCGVDTSSTHRKKWTPSGWYPSRLLLRCVIGIYNQVAQDSSRQSLPVRGLLNCFDAIRATPSHAFPEHHEAAEAASPQAARKSVPR